MEELVVSSRVQSNHAGATLLSYLCRRFTYLSEEEWSDRIVEGRILINRQRSEPRQRVVQGDVVTYRMPDFVEPPADLNYKIVYRDDWLLGVDKPGNLLVHRHGRSFRSNLIYQLRHAHIPPFPHAHIVNRLDRGTSGIVLVAQDSRTLSAMHRLFEERKVEKTYLAVVRGTPADSAGVIDAPIGGAGNPGVFAVGGANMREAKTQYRVVRVLGSTHSLIEVHPLTGRTHQIRVHLNHLGTPIVGDPIYGERNGEKRVVDECELPVTLLSRQALHCSTVSFRHPITGSLCTIQAPLPPDMLRAIDKLDAMGG